MVSLTKTIAYKMRHHLSSTAWYDIDTLPESISPDFDTIWKLCPEERETRKLFGKVVTVPRFSRNYGVDYQHSGKVHKAERVPDALSAILEYVKHTYGGSYEQMLINWYVNGNDSIAMHSDDEKGIQPDSPIVSVSLGETRTFIVENKRTKDKIKLPLVSGSVLIMGGTFQKDYLHGIPKEKNKERRVNLTFRLMNQ